MRATLTGIATLGNALTNDSADGDDMCGGTA